MKLTDNGDYEEANTSGIMTQRTFPFTTYESRELSYWKSRNFRKQFLPRRIKLAHQ